MTFDLWLRGGLNRKERAERARLSNGFQTGAVAGAPPPADARFSGRRGTQARRVSLNPFLADPAVPARLAAQDGDGARGEAAAVLEDQRLSGAEARRIADRFGLGDDDLLLHLLPLAHRVARPAISGFRVGAVGRTAGRGDLILGGNIEVPGAALHHTLHAEGFVAIRAWQRGEALAALAIGEAHPCAHCRQVLAEFAAAGRMILLDPLGHRLDLDRLYPWPFDPAYLGQAGASAGVEAWPGLIPPADLPTAVAALLRASGRASHAPYSGCPAAVAVEGPGGLFAGGVIESVAFNPTLTPLQTALVALVAGGGEPAAITRAWLVQPEEGAVDLARTTADLLAAIAPGAALTVHGWSR